MSEFLIILGCAVGFAVMGLLTRGLTHHEHAHNGDAHSDAAQDEAALKRSLDGSADSTESCGGCSLQCETTEPDHV